MNGARSSAMTHDSHRQQCLERIQTEVGSAGQEKIVAAVAPHATRQGVPRMQSETDQTGQRFVILGRLNQSVATKQVGCGPLEATAVVQRDFHGTL